MRKHRLAPLLVLLLATLIGGASCDNGEDRAPIATAGGAGGSGGAAGGAGSGAENVQIPGLSGEVSAVYDEHGFLHLTCATDDDCSAAMGYFHAANRFFFMDFVRHLVRGQLGAIVNVGELVLNLDYQNRQFFATPEGKPLEDAFIEQADPGTRGALEAYARGVNAWIEDMKAKRNGAALTDEYKFAALVKDKIRPWEPQDSAAVGLYMLRDLSESSSGEIYLADVLVKLDKGLASDLLAIRPLYDAFTLTSSGVPGVGPTSSPLGPSGQAPSLPFSPQAHQRAQSYGPLLSRALAGYNPEASGHQRAKGSNNWVLSPERTTAKKGLLCNDPHLQLSNPSIWFPIELDGKSKGSGSYHVAGGSFPGLPLVLTGHNEDIAWGVTVVYYDLTDVYVEELSDDGKKVKFKGDLVSIVEKEFTFEDASTGKPIQKTLRWVPHHGPILSEDLEKKQALTVRWVAHQGSSDLQGFFALGRAKSTLEAREALKFITSANQNFIVIDRKGDIGWFPYGKIPRRPWASPDLPPWLPLPGNGSAEWDGFVPVDQLPQMLNPPAGFIATANQEMSGASADGDPTNDGQEAIQSWDKADGTRMKRIVDLIAAGGNNHTPETMQAIQGDTRILLGELIVPSLLDAAKTSQDAGVTEVASALAPWQFTCPTGLAGDKKDSPKSTDTTESRESIGCSAFHITLYALGVAAFEDELKAAGVNVGSVDRANMLARALGKPGTLLGGEAFWDDVSTTDKVETREEILVAAMSAAAKTLGALGASKDEWRWGRIHTLTLRSIFDNFGVSSYNFGPFSTPGGIHSVNVAIPSATKDLDLYHTSGASLRTVLEVDKDGPRMRFQYPGGASLHRDSPFYNNMVSRWLKNEPVAFPFGPGAMEKVAVQIAVKPSP
ncbi:MAG: penicillin acylase family protein [Myxococcales bacterium]|nr:penicillin acylase family protein [Polyangiaceae bacterium]MDW8250679.1 penicillin acylase family protein [Myxococcales bacterium]